MSTQKKLSGLGIAGLVLLIPTLSVGCAAQSTYFHAVGKWQSQVQPKEEASAECAPGKMTWVAQLTRKVVAAMEPQVELQVYRDGSYIAQVGPAIYSGHVELTAIFGDGLGVKTQIGQVEARGRIQVVDRDQMVIKGQISDQLGTELTLHRVP
ncbi:MAG: hypothetical protein GWP39_00895 [Planctomycetia bacterium]|jgi:hypothetical protein|nr:hypothetical protein [Planctomycetia bacterium]NCG13073.1 hypothetical protein [Planctomycetia bacterium]